MSIAAIHVSMPLTDITNVRMFQTGKSSFGSPLSCRSNDCSISPEARAPQQNKTQGVYVHNPYGWKCLPDDEQHAAAILSQRSFEMRKLNNRSQSVLSTTPASDPLFMEERDQTPPAPAAPPVCRALVQFKCHQTEFASPLAVEKGQYVVVQGDRGIDIGVIIRVNSESEKSYVERTGPTGSILRHATQREVDYWATELKGDEAAALEYCCQRVLRHHLQMEVRHAEYQFDKKKLTFYYDAKSRVDFVQLLKELYREFGCRIWMEKVRVHE